MCIRFVKVSRTSFRENLQLVEAAHSVANLVALCAKKYPIGWINFQSGLCQVSCSKIDSKIFAFSVDDIK